MRQGGDVPSVDQVTTDNATQAHVIQARGLCRQYGRTRAVDDLTFDVRPGVVTGFLGPNGAGKTTTLRMILGLDRPTSGVVLVSGRHYRELTHPQHEVGALLDAKAAHPRRSGRDHLRWQAQAGGIPVRRVDEVLGLVGLSDVADRRAGSYSLGMAQRLGIAGALLGDPSMLILDEPVNGLDPEGIRWIRTLLRGLAAEGRTVLLSSHLMSEMEQTADQVLVIGRGRLLADMTMAEFTRQAGGGEIAVLSPDADRLTELLRLSGATVEVGHDGRLQVSGTTSDRIGDLAALHSLRVYELTPRQASLETAYLASTTSSVDYRQGPS
jgi:ABC-2 type transport system ATP-binding protein